MSRQGWVYRHPGAVAVPAVMLLVVGFWQLLVSVFEVSRFTLPPPMAVAREFGLIVMEPEIWGHARLTLTEILWAFGLALLSGVVIGTLLGKIVLLERAFRPIIVAFQVTPKVALLPLFIVWFGFGIASKVAMGAVLAFFPIMLNVLLGVRSVDSGHRDVMRSLSAGRWEMFRHVELKSTLPYVFAGLEVGVVLATIGVIVGEFLGSTRGLGAEIVNAMGSFDAPRLFAILIMLSGLGFALFSVVTLLKRVTISWHDSVRLFAG